MKILQGWQALSNIIKGNSTSKLFFVISVVDYTPHLGRVGILLPVKLIFNSFMMAFLI